MSGEILNIIAIYYTVAGINIIYKKNNLNELKREGLVANFCDVFLSGINFYYLILIVNILSRKWILLNYFQ